MNKKTLNTGFVSIVLLLVFINPLIVKSFHTYGDHPHYKSSTYYNNKSAVSAKIDDFCPINEFQFSVNDIPVAFFPVLAKDVYSELIILPAEMLVYSNDCRLFSSRAPPSFS